MIAYKGFNKDMTCHFGKGIFQYEVGKTYTEKYADAHERGFHCAQNPLDCLKWYGDRQDKICIVEAAGDISEDGRDTKIACTKMKILRELTRHEFVCECIKYIARHPDLEHTRVNNDKGTPINGFVIVKGKDPKAKGKDGDILGLLKTEGNAVTAAAVYVVGEDVKADTYKGIE